MNFEQYSEQKAVVNGILTYVLDSACFPQIYGSLEVFSGLEHSKSLMEQADAAIEVIRRNPDIPLKLAIVKFHWRKKFSWEITLIYWKNQELYHVSFHESWLCTSCGHKTGRALLLKGLDDPLFRADAKQQKQEIPSLFQNARCPRCGGWLQNYLYLL